MSINGKGTYKKRPASAFLSEDPMIIRMNTLAKRYTRDNHQPIRGSQRTKKGNNFINYTLKI